MSEPAEIRVATQALSVPSFAKIAKMGQPRGETQLIRAIMRMSISPLTSMARLYWRAVRVGWLSITTRRMRLIRVW